VCQGVAVPFVAPHAPDWSGIGLHHPSEGGNSALPPANMRVQGGAHARAKTAAQRRHGAGRRPDPGNGGEGVRALGYGGRNDLSRPLPHTIRAPSGVAAPAPLRIWGRRQGVGWQHEMPDSHCASELQSAILSTLISGVRRGTHLMRLHVNFITVLLALVGAVATLAPSIPEASAAAATAWSQLGTLPPSSNLVINAVACPSASTCYATASFLVSPGPGIYSVIFATTDGGATWNSQSVPSGVGVGAISCPSASTCYAAAGPGAVLLVTTNGGSQWTTEAVPPAPSSLSGVACTTTLDCVVVGAGPQPGSGAIFTTTNGGASWSTATVPPFTLFAQQSVYCPSASMCYSVGGNIATTTDGGASWQVHAVPPGVVGYLSSVACPSTTTCYAVGSGQGGMGEIITTTNSGSSWQVLSPPAGFTTSPQSHANLVSCTSTTTCFVGGNVLIGTADGGQTWTQQAVPLSVAGFTAITCNFSSCVALGSEGAADGTWHALGGPPVNGYWLVAADGGIFNFGNAGFYGSAGSLPLNKPVVGMAPTTDKAGYWLVATDGGIFNYGDAGFFGSAGSLPLNKPVVGMAATPDGKGYWLVASDGGIFNYGDAGFFGSMGGTRLNKPIVGAASAS
jgi:photosystem II stability/assembly factor-like uncharacterized protein